MKSLFRFSLLFFLVSFSCAKSNKLVNGLSFVKEKVEKAIKGDSVVKFKDYLNKKQNSQAKVGQSVENSDLENNFEFDEKSFHWCKQDELVRVLEASLRDKNQAMSILKNEVSKKYENEKYPILFFSKELLRERSNIQTLINQGLKNTQITKKTELLRTKNVKMFDKLMGWNTTLSRLIDVVEKLLVS